MSEFGILLESAAERRSAKEIAADMGVDASLISQFTSGGRESCRPETLMKMVAGISPEPDAQAALLQAYFRDQCIDRYKPWIKVEPVPKGHEPTARSSEDSPDYGDAIGVHNSALRELRLPNAIVRALTFIAQAIPGRPKFRIVIEDLGDFAREDLLKKSTKRK